MKIIGKSEKTKNRIQEILNHPRVPQVEQGNMIYSAYTVVDDDGQWYRCTVNVNEGTARGLEIYIGDEEIEPHNSMLGKFRDWRSVE